MNASIAISITMAINLIILCLRAHSLIKAFFAVHPLLNFALSFSPTAFLSYTERSMSDIVAVCACMAFVYTTHARYRLEYIYCVQQVTVLLSHLAVAGDLILCTKS